MTWKNVMTAYVFGYSVGLMVSSDGHAIGLFWLTLAVFMGLVTTSPESWKIKS